MPAHINLTVSDVAASVDFYRRWLGFGHEDRRFPDGTVFVRDADGTDLAFHPGAPPDPPPSGFHFGVRRDSPEAVRELGRRAGEDGVPVVAYDDDPGLVSLKLVDPDGYQVEVYWEG